MTLANQQDVEQALTRELEAEETPWVQAMLTYIEALITTRLPDALTRAAANPAWRTIVIHVEAEATARVLRAPGGGLYSYETEGTYTYSINKAVASGILEVTDAEWKALTAGTNKWTALDPVMDGYAARVFTGLKEGVLYSGTVRPTGVMPPPCDPAGTTDLDEDDPWW